MCVFTVSDVLQSLLLLWLIFRPLICCFMHTIFILLLKNRGFTQWCQGLAEWSCLGDLISFNPFLSSRLCSALKSLLCSLRFAQLTPIHSHTKIDTTLHFRYPHSPSHKHLYGRDSFAAHFSPSHKLTSHAHATTPLLPHSHSHPCWCTVVLTTLTHRAFVYVCVCGAHYFSFSLTHRSRLTVKR